MPGPRAERALTASCLAGVLLSAYALHVEMALHADPHYRAACDLSPRMSCTRVLGSRYATGLGLAEKGSALDIPNCVFGIGFYSFMILLNLIDNKWVAQFQYLALLGSNFLSVYLAYLLYLLGDICVVCTSIYAVNALATVLAHSRKQSLTAAALQKSPKKTQKKD